MTMERWEQELVRDLQALRREPPFGIDVRARVLREIARAPRRAPLVSPRQLGGSLAVALVLLAALAGFAALRLPAVLGVLPEGAGLAAIAARTMVHLAGSGVLGFTATLRALAEALHGTGAYLAAVRPVAHAAAGLVLLLMLLTTARIVGRDLRAPARSVPQETGR